MTPDQKAKRSEMLIELLRTLSTEDPINDPEKLKELTEQVVKIYSGGYRQQYSDLLYMLGLIKNDSDQYDAQNLSDNLEILAEFIRDRDNGYDTALYLNINKLADHIGLELQRDRDYENLLSKTKEVSRNANNEMNKLKEELNSASAEIKKAHEEAQRSKMETVAILSIFSAIVIAFAGGLDFFGGTISAAGNNIFDVAFAILLCGLMFFNIIAFLMYMVLAVIRLHDPPRNDEEGGFYKRITSCTGGTFAFWLDVVLIVAMAITMFLGFYFGN